MSYRKYVTETIYSDGAIFPNEIEIFRSPNTDADGVLNIKWRALCFSYADGCGRMHILCS